MKPVTSKNSGRAIEKTPVKNVALSNKNMLSVRGLLAWISKTLEAEVGSINDLRTGAIYCQILHRLFPNVAMLKKVRMGTMYEFEFEANFRLLMSAFTQLGIDHDVPVYNLMKGSGNYIFCSWLYQFYLANDKGNSYDAKVMREYSEIGLKSKSGLKRSLSLICKPNHEIEQYNYRRSSSAVEVQPRYENLIEAEPVQPEGGPNNENNEDVDPTSDSDSEEENEIQPHGGRVLLNNLMTEDERRHELEVLRARKQYRDCVAKLDSIKSILLEYPNDIQYSLNQIRGLIGTNSGSDSGIE